MIARRLSECHRGVKHLARDSGSSHFLLLSLLPFAMNKQMEDPPLFPATLYLMNWRTEAADHNWNLLLLLQHLDHYGYIWITLHLNIPRLSSIAFPPASSVPELEMSVRVTPFWKVVQ